MKLKCLPALLLTMAVPATAAGQADASAPCEIHVWPSAQLNSLTEGAVWNNVLDSAITAHGARVTERAVPQSALSIEEQRTHLMALNIAALLNVPGATVTIHRDRSQRRATGGSSGRQTASTSQCYRELTIAKLFFSRSSMAGRTLRTLLIYDDFGTQPLPIRSFIGWAATPLIIFPAKQSENESAAAAELAAAFKANFVKFTGYALAEKRRN